MIDWPSRLMLAVTTAVVFFSLAGMVLGGPDPRQPDTPVAVSTTASIPGWALAPAVDANPAATGSTAPPTAPPASPVTVALGGDVHGEAPIDAVLDDGDSPLGETGNVLDAADLAIVNLETPIATRGTPADKEYTFRADPGLATALAEAGVDVVNLANNHALDHGHAALEETILHLTRAGIATVGYGEDATDAYAAHIAEVEGQRIAVVGLTRVMPTIDWAAGADRPGLASAYDADAAVQAVRNAAELSDHVVVSIHWGRERWTCPDSDQLLLANRLAEVGADVIAGHHPHVLQGVVAVGDALVAYSLGNLVFYARTPATRQSGVLTVTLQSGGATSHTWSPALIDGQGRPQPTAVQTPISEGEELTATSSGPECGPPS